MNDQTLMTDETGAVERWENEGGKCLSLAIQELQKWQFTKQD